MKTTGRLLTGILLLSGGLSAQSVMAFEAISGDVAEKSGGFVGLGIGFAPDYEGSDDQEVIPAPLGHYTWARGRYVDLGGTSGSERAARLKVNALSSDSNGGWELGPLLQYRLKRDDDVDNDQVSQMKEVDAAIEAGAFVGYAAGPWSASVSFAADISDEYSGYLGYLNGAYELPVNSSFNLTIGAHLTYADSDYMETYFGVDGANSVRSGLPVYSASSGFKDVGLSVTGLYKFNKSWGVLGNLGYTRMINDAEDSPLVNDVGNNDQLSGVLAVTYSF